MLRKTVFILLFYSLLCLARISHAATPEPIGIWNLAGTDQGNNAWIATLVLSHSATNPKILIGYADWASNTGFGGREYVTGTYNPVNRVLKFHGTKTKYPRNIVRGSYMAVQSIDGKRLTNGKWSDFDPTIPGKWNAVHIVPQ